MVYSMVQYKYLLFPPTGIPTWRDSRIARAVLASAVSAPLLRRYRDNPTQILPTPTDDQGPYLSIVDYGYTHICFSRTPAPRNRWIAYRACGSRVLLSGLIGHLALRCAVSMHTTAGCCFHI